MHILFLFEKLRILADYRLILLLQGIDILIHCFDACTVLHALTEVHVAANAAGAARQLRVPRRKL